MADILDNTMVCSFCNCKFKVEKDDVETIKVHSSVGYYHYDVFKRIKCPICGENAMMKKIGIESCKIHGLI